ncbi:MAG: cytidine deaminase [Myxococcales bacterium]|nr:cytidine deaminase [Myxococcales bacterium]
MARRPQKIQWTELARLAESMRARAYAPYSNYRVGAVLIARKDADGQNEVFVGANVENASYGLCACAERNAVAAAVLAGMKEFVALAVATEGPRPAAPCGMCRQVLAEFSKDLPIALVVGAKIVDRTSLAELLPRMFNGAHLDEAKAHTAAKKTARSKKG